MGLIPVPLLMAHRGVTMSLGSSSPCGGRPCQGTALVMLTVVVHPVEHPQEWSEGVRVRPPRGCHRPLRAVRVQWLQAGSSAPGPTLCFRLRGKLHADVLHHRRRHLQGTGGVVVGSGVVLRSGRCGGWGRVGHALPFCSGIRCPLTRTCPFSACVSWE